MIRFECDYAEGAHPLVLERLIQTNFKQTKGYGEDEFCANARRIIRQLCDFESADVHFFVAFQYLQRAVERQLNFSP